MEAVECGAAALGIVLGHYGRLVPLADLRRECAVSRDGSRASNIVKAARRYGLDAKGYSKGMEAVQEVAPPFIVFWHFNHFLVVEGFDGDRVWLNDPAVGHRTVTLDEFDEGFTGVTLVMRPTDAFEPGGRPPSLRRALGARLAGAWGGLAFCIGAGFLLVLPGLALPAFTQVFLDSVLAEGRGDWLRPLLLAMAAAALLRTLLRFLQLRALRRLRLSLAARLSAQFFWHLLRLPAGFYAQRFAGEVTARAGLNDKVAGILSGQLASTAIDVVMMAFYAALMLAYDVPLTLIAVAFALTNFVALRLLARRRIEANLRLLQEYGKVSGAAIGGLQAIETIKSSGQEPALFARLTGYQASASNAQRDLESSNQVLGILPTLLTSVATMLVLAVGGVRVIDGALTIGMLIAFQSLTLSFLGPINGLVALGGTIQELRGDLARLDDVLTEAPDPEAPTATVEPASGGAEARLQGGLALRGVTFGYSPLEPPLIEDFDLTLRPGRRVALVGGSGSGKSTLARLICGLYAPWSGEILFDGRPRAEAGRELVRDSVALVDQDIALFSGTVRENLTLWDATIPDDVLVAACRDAEILDVVMSLPGAFDGQLAEGASNLSGGQRQRLEIARALVQRPSLLVLDEATSALDAETERVIVERLRLRGCSCVVVAHRLSTIRDCDEILVLARGKVVERGTHEALWNRGGAYAALLRSAEGAP